LKHNYSQINRDTLKAQEKCLKEAEIALKAGKSVVIDNTNPSKKARADYIAIAKKLGIKKIRCFKMNTQIELCHHLNYVRQNQTAGKIRRIPDVGYNMFKSQFEQPVLSEGFSEIKEIDFSPKFENPEHETIFKQWT
jgi:bifunctional polynucleotide phosphatase/kinase